MNKLKPFTKWVGGKRQLEAMKYIGKVFNYKMIESGYLKDYIDQIKKLEYDDIKLKKRTWDVNCTPKIGHNFWRCSFLCQNIQKK